MANQYFQFVWKEQEAFLHFFPATDGGKRLDINEVTEYLVLRQYTQYDIKELNRAITNFDVESEVKVGVWDGNEVREQMKMQISLDKMKVTCRFYPPSEGGQLMDTKEIISQLNFHKIKYGINQEQILAFVSNRTYCTDICLAQGTMPVHGKDAKIEYFFNVNHNMQPKRNEDGSVNYKELNTISHVKKGDLLARVIPMDCGKSGKNIFGEEVKPRSVKNATLKYGRNIIITEDNMELYSDVTGHVSLIDDKVFVSDVFEIPADVDTSTGNIEYEGSVLIHGSVKSGFVVKASGDIIIEGDVEGAEIYSDSQIIIKQGIHGMYKGVIEAGMNVIARSIENATIRAKGFVEAEMILHSQVDAGSAVRVHSKKGLIIGGTVRAKNSIEADNIGNDMETVTVLEVGIEPHKKERYIELTKEVKNRTQEIEDTKVILNNYASLLKKGEHIPQDKLKYAQKLAAELKVKSDENEAIKDEVRSIYSEMLLSDQSYVSATGSVHPGVTVGISDLSYVVKDKKTHCKFKKQNGQVECVVM